MLFDKKEGIKMLEELKGTEVTIQMGSASVVTDAIKGKVIEVGESWIKIQTKKNLEYINLTAVGRIITKI